jgi:hypothetical protein
MDILTANGISLVDFLYYSALFILGMVVFLQRNRPGMRMAYFLWIGAFLTTWVVALLSPRPAATKVFLTILLISSSIVQTALARRTGVTVSVTK